jgi:hypothetical protein
MRNREVSDGENRGFSNREGLSPLLGFSKRVISKSIPLL